MKAIHNVSQSFIKSADTVFNISKIQNESNSQLSRLPPSLLINCVQYFKDTK